MQPRELTQGAIVPMLLLFVLAIPGGDPAR